MKNGPLQIKRLLEQYEAGHITEAQFMSQVQMNAKRYTAKLMKLHNEDRPLPSRMGTARKTHRPLRQYC